MKLSISHIAAAVALLTSVAAQAQSVLSYDVSNAQLTGFGGWSHTYNGIITSVGGGLYNYTGGAGTLNDGIVPTSHIGNELFRFENNSSITLHLNGQVSINEIDFFGGNVGGSNSIPGTLTGATVTIGGNSVALSSLAWGPNCQSTLCNDKLSLTGTSLAGMRTDTVTLSNFQGGWGGYYNAGEITVTAVPEPETYAMLLAGLGILGAVARRKKQATRA